jgi:hypothetical protein
MNWAAETTSRSDHARGRGRIPARAGGTGAMLRPSETAPAVPRSRGGLVSPVGGPRRMLSPALAPHPTRRKASSGVISLLACLFEPPSGFVSRDAWGKR